MCIQSLQLRDCICALQFCSYHEEDLLQPSDRPEVPGRLEVHAVRVAADQVLRQDHDEPGK